MAKQQPTNQKQTPRIDRKRMQMLVQQLQQHQTANYRRDINKRKKTNPIIQIPPWELQVLTATSEKKLSFDKSANHDEQRQLQIYAITHENVTRVLNKLKQLGVKNERPHDYLGEMYKSDTHMGKIRKHLTEKQVNIKQSMQNKKWEKRKKKSAKRGVGPEKQKLIKKYKNKQSKDKAKGQKLKAPKMTKFRGKRIQKK